jgi:hypothetical protein
MAGIRRHDIPSILVVDDRFRLYAQSPLRGMESGPIVTLESMSETAEAANGRHNKQMASHLPLFLSSLALRKIMAFYATKLWI